VKSAKSRVHSRLIRAAACESSVYDRKHQFHTEPPIVGRALGWTWALPHPEAHESAPGPRPDARKFLTAPRESTPTPLGESSSPRRAKVPRRPGRKHPHPAARKRPSPRAAI